MYEGVSHMADIQANCQYVKLSKSDIFGILQNDRRRNVLELLRNKGSQSVRSLSEEIALLEAGNEESKSSIRKSIYVSLLQTHIPKMESLGIVTYDREKDCVELLPASRKFEVYMETVNKGDIPWSQYYLGISVLAVFGSIMIFEGLVKWVSNYHWMFFISLIFLISSVIHQLHSQKLKG